MDKFLFAKEYFEELKIKAGEALKEHWPDAEEYLHDLFQKEAATDTASSSEVLPRINS